MQYPSGKKYTLGYTPRGELRSLYDAATPTEFEAYYIYDPSGNLLTRNLDYYQTHSTSVFDPQVNRLTQIQHILNGKSPKFNYGYDKMNNRTYEQRDGALVDGYRYDDNNQLTSFWYDGTTSGPPSDRALSTIAYDASGNRTNKVEDGAPTTTYGAGNNLNQYPTVGGLAATYDGNGNLKTYDDWTYQYDAMSRLISAAKGSASASFWYDGLNRICTWQENGSANTRFNVWDGWDLVAEYKSGTTSSPDTEYLHGAGSDEMVSMTRNGQTYYFFQHADGSTSHVADSSGILVETCWYWISGGEPYIQVASGKTATGNRFLFTGREYFASIGLYNYRNRFYSPAWGRFLQPDPIGFAGDPANLYRYVANNPVNWSDPYGLNGGDKPVKKHKDGSWTIGGLPYPDDPAGMPNPNGAGEMPRIVGPGGGSPESFRGFAGVNFSTGGAPSGVGGPGGLGSGGAAYRHGRMERSIPNAVLRIPHESDPGVTIQFTFRVIIYDPTGKPVGPYVPVTEKIDRPVQVDFHPIKNRINTTTYTNPGGWFRDPNDLPFTSNNGQLTTMQTIFFNGMKASWTHTVFANSTDVQFQGVAYFEPIQ